MNSTPANGTAPIIDSSPVDSAVVLVASACTEDQVDAAGIPRKVRLVKRLLTGDCVGVG